MAKTLIKSLSPVRSESIKVRRPGVHAKTKTSKLKSSKLYKKTYRGQGK